MAINTAIEIKKNIKIGEKDQIMYENKNLQKDYFSPLPHPHPPSIHFIIEGCGTADLYYSDYITLHFLSTALIFIRLIIYLLF